MKYKNKLIDYIIETESENFWECLDEEGWLTDTQYKLLVYQVNNRLELDTKIMKKLATKHIFAVAYLAERESK